MNLHCSSRGRASSSPNAVLHVSRVRRPSRGARQAVLDRRPEERENLNWVLTDSNPEIYCIGEWLSMEATILRWAGSKRQLVELLSAHVPKTYNRYVEPFAGSACLFFQIRPQAAVLGDINRRLIDTYRAVRWAPHQVAKGLQECSLTEEAYYAERAMLSEKAPLVEHAVRFIYLNRLCFNGLYRTNAAGAFNVPYGGQKCKGMPSSAILTAARNALRGTHLVAGDFSRTLRHVCEGDFVYLDPPYRTSGRRTFREYDAGDFSAQDLARLRRWLHRLDFLGATFLVSYADCPDAVSLAEGYYKREVSVRRNISGFLGSRGKVTEVLISNRPLRRLT